MTKNSEQLIPVWEKTLSYLQGRVNEQTFTAWFKPITPLYIDGTGINLGVPNEFFKEWVSERYADLIMSCLTIAAGEKIQLVFTAIGEKESVDKKTKAEPQKSKPGILSSIFPRYAKDHQPRQIGLNPKYTFEAFVVGPNNRFAHAASLAISESPAKTYNPLFIHGGVGLGKTHLMHAIGNFVSSKSPKTKILYISSEEFTNQLISAIQTRTTVEFRKKYRNVDVLLIDDIHFIAGKEATQEEFFHTFNTLYDAHKQIIMSSDRSPKEIPTLEERLVSRFGWGLVTDVQLPDFETRIAILKKKSERETVPVPNDVLYFLGDNIKTNIRELEGALIRVVAYAKLTGKNMSVDAARETLKGMITEGKKNINVALIQKKVAEFFDISFQDMKTKKRTQTIVHPRQIAMYLCRGLTSLSLPEIGAYFGGRDHTTIIHACNKIEKELKSKENIRKAIDQLTHSIKG